MIPVSQTMEADVVIVGGGIGGAMAAISAAESGAKRVVVLEKCHTRRSGSGASGNDHFVCYIPEVHGDNVEPLLNLMMNSFVGLGKDRALMRMHLLESFELVKKWESWGIDMRPLGHWNFQGHTLPGMPCPFLKMNGRNQKKVLAEQMNRHGVTVLNHHPVVELARENGRISGALALDISREEPSFVLVKAPNVIIATGLTHRLYVNATTPNYLFNTSHCPNNAGGQALGWRAGAAMVNMELPFCHAGTKYFQRAGKGTWIGVYRYPDGSPLGPFVTKPDPKYGDPTSDVWNTAFLDVMANGRGPAYLDCSENTPENLAYMRKAMFDEGLSALLDYMDDKGIDPARHAVEFTRFEPILMGRGLDVDQDGRTTVPGLFAAGDVAGNFGSGVAFAAWLGWRSGRAAAGDIPPVSTTPLEENSAVSAKMALLSSFMERENGTDWKDANIALTQIMSDYAAVGPYHVRSATLLRAGLTYLQRLRAETDALLCTSTAHELMRAAEVLDLFDCAEAIMRSAIERRESRGLHKRSDYTFTNPLLATKMLDIFRKDDGSVVTAWRDMRM